MDMWAKETPLCVPIHPHKEGHTCDLLSFLPQLLSFVLDWLCDFPDHVIWKDKHLLSFSLFWLHPSAEPFVLPLSITSGPLWLCETKLLGIPHFGVPPEGFTLRKNYRWNLKNQNWIYPGNLNYPERFSLPHFRRKKQVTFMLTP